MNRAVVVGAYHGNAEALELLLQSLTGCRWPVVIVVSGGAMAPPEWLAHLETLVEVHVDWHLFVNAEDTYELGAFARVLLDTRLDEFLFLQDTFEVLDQSFIDRVMAHDGPVALGPAMFHYAAKWRREILEKMVLPVVRNKRQSVHWEHAFSSEYLRLETKPLWVVDPHFHDGEHKGFVKMFGRTNMLLENDWYRKRKADWGQRPL